MPRKQEANFKAFQRTVGLIDVEPITEKWEFEDALRSLQTLGKVTGANLTQGRPVLNPTDSSLFLWPVDCPELCTSSKIIETAMCRSLNSFCEKFKIFDESQFGFRKKRSTTMAVYHYIQKALEIINNKQYAIGILLDLSKAYERVSFKILLSKLYGIGVRGIAHNWFASYLSGRQQCVEVDKYDPITGGITNCRSEKCEMPNSIPQGTVLGCVLFLVIVNDLPKVIQNHCVAFADDVPRQKNPIEIKFSMGQTIIECIHNFTLLGLEIDTNITWKAHIEKIKNKLSRLIYALSEINRSTDLQTALAAYYAYAYSWLHYGVILWGNSTAVQASRLEMFSSSTFVMCIKIYNKIPQHLRSEVDDKSFLRALKDYLIGVIVLIGIVVICRRVRNNKNEVTAVTSSSTGTPEAPAAATESETAIQPAARSVSMCQVSDICETGESARVRKYNSETELKVLKPGYVPNKLVFSED
ncbi:hypothetical protein evm_008292 [Chilo suppressalis]|nr:hypothetical protein evm_008292 [Chilo suppressalis]